jgi:hypothetical protein
MTALCAVMRAMVAVVGGIIAGLGLGGGAAAIIECVGADHAPVPPVIVAGLGLRLGVGMLVASAVSGQARSRA